MGKLFLLILISFNCLGQVASIRLSNGTTINNAPSGRSWTGYKATGITLQDAYDTLIIDDSETDKITYYGNWTMSNSCLCSYAGTPNDSMVFKFTNSTWFGWYGEQMSHQGNVEVYWNNQYIETIDTYSSNNKQLTLNWFIDNLDTMQVYSFKLIPTGTKNPSSSGTYIVNHYIKLIKSIEAEPDPGPGPDPDIPCDCTEINHIDSITYKEIITYKDSTIYNYKDSTILKYDTTGTTIRVDSFYVFPKQLIFKLK